MSDTSEIQQLREEVQELRVLYHRLAESMLRTEKATPEEIESLEAEDEVVGKEEFLKILRETPFKGRRRSSV